MQTRKTKNISFSFFKKSLSGRKYEMKRKNCTANNTNMELESVNFNGENVATSNLDINICLKSS
jgi:hypothetical protein